MNNYTNKDNTMKDKIIQHIQGTVFLGIIFMAPVVLMSILCAVLGV